MKPSATPRSGSRREPERTRAAILDAAVHEFAREGVAGARTDAIARAARVNKALLYYYFKDKEALYGAALDRVFSELSARVSAVLDRDLPAREKILAYAGTHFDFIASSPLYPRLFQREMMRAGRKGSPHIRRIAHTYLMPNFLKLVHLLEQGIATGEFRKVNVRHFIISMISVIVFYFGSAPMVAIMSGQDPYKPENIAERRAAVLDFICAALFRYPEKLSNGRRTKCTPD